MDVEEQILKSMKLKIPRVTILTEILKEKAKLDKDLEKENNAILKDFLETFIPEMAKQDELFASLYHSNYYTGSYYSNLRVAIPDEYDINIVLKLPFKAQEFSVEYHPQVPSYVKYKIRGNGLPKFFEDGYLIPNRVRAWMQSVVARAINNYSHSNIKMVKSKTSGPASTIILKKKEGQIDIDLVPVVQRIIEDRPPHTDDRVYNKTGSKLQFFLVPKLYEPTKQSAVSAAERSLLWRAHYPDAEEEIIHDVGCAKLVIKLLKLLRDKYNWGKLASYYLKTVVMWMLIKNASAEHWKLDKLGERFLDALDALADYVKQRKISFVFNLRCNLLEKLSEAEAEIIYNTLRGIIKNIKSDYMSLWKIFDCERTF